MVDRTQRLAGIDRAFFALEAPGRPMHVGVLAVLTMPDGQTASSLRALLIDRLGRIPELVQPPRRGRRGRGACFDPAEFVYSLPTRADIDSVAFRERLGRLHARALDTNGPLWEAWLMTGLDDGRRAALLFKVHHALADGASLLGLLGSVCDGIPLVEPIAAPRPRRQRAGVIARGLLGHATRLFRPLRASTLSGTPAPNRQVELLRLDVSVLREAARGTEGTINDVVLALVADGMRRALPPAADDTQRVRAMVPVDLRAPGEVTRIGNRIGAWLVDLPLFAGSLKARIASVRAATIRARRTGEAPAVGFLARFCDWLPPALPSGLLALAGWLRTFNLTVTHVRGPDTPLRFGGAAIEQVVALAPIFARQRCAIAAFRYGDAIHLSIVGAWPGAIEHRAVTEGIAAAYAAIAPTVRLPAHAHADFVVDEAPAFERAG